MDSVSEFVLASVCDRHCLCLFFLISILNIKTGSLKGGSPYLSESTLPTLSLPGRRATYLNIVKLNS